MVICLHCYWVANWMWARCQPHNYIHMHIMKATLLITTAGHMGYLSTLLNVWGGEPILHSRSQYLRPLFQVVPMHKPADQPGVGPLPLMSGHVSHLWPTFPMPVQDGSHRGKQLCLENSIQEQISQHLSNHTSKTWDSILDSSYVEYAVPQMLSVHSDSTINSATTEFNQHWYERTQRIVEAHILWFYM